jgi:protein-(glutamine-N5) methyltransferase, release factor-specific
MSTPSVAELLKQATQQLSASSPSARLDAELLLCHVLGFSRARLLAEGQFRPSEAQVQAFQNLVERRLNLEPVAYLTGEKAFYDLDFYVDKRVLIPRPETELLVERALLQAKTRPAPVRIADIGTGSGAIAITLAVHLPDADVSAVDISPEALSVAQRNAERHNVQARLKLLLGDLTAPLSGSYDLIVSNPPYTILAEIDENVRRHEPHLALDGGEQGMEIYRRLLAELPPLLKPDGAILLEIGAWQAQMVSELAHTHFPHATVAVFQDLAGLDRVVEISLRG